MRERLREAARLGRCGPISRALGLAAARTRLPGSELVAFGLLGKPRGGPVEIGVERDGLRWRLDLRDDAHRLFYLGLYETDLRLRVMRALGEGGTFVDVGANVGFWSVLAARRAGPTGRVVAFEPNPWAVGYLKGNVDRNREASAPVTVHAVAVGDAPGVLRLHASDLEALASQVTAYPERHDEAFVDVPVLTLDGAVEEPIDVLKIDVEGHELSVLEGADTLLENRIPRFVVIEMQDALLARAGSSAEGLAQRLEALGYTTVDGDGSLGRESVPRPLRVGFYETVVWCRTGRSR